MGQQVSADLDGRGRKAGNRALILALLAVGALVAVTQPFSTL